MRCFYEAVIEEDEDGFVVRFPQFPGAITQGDTYVQAIDRAAECLELEIASLLGEGKCLPEFYTEGNPYTVICVNVTQDMIDACQCLSYAQAASELGISKARVSQLVSAGRLQAVTIAGQRMVTIASVNARKECPPPAHRPKSKVEMSAAVAK